MILSETEKWNYINNLDEELLLDGVIISEWTTFLVKDAEIAFCSGAYLSSILACQAAIECHLRYEYFGEIETKRWSFFKLIENSQLNDKLISELHELRKYRNKWIHVNDPHADSQLLEKPEYYEDDLFMFSKKAIKIMLMVIYSNQYL